MTSKPEPARPPRRRRKWVLRSLGLAILAGVLVSAVVTYNRFTDPEHIRASAEAYLQKFVRGRVTVRSAGFSWLDGIRLFDVTVAESRPGQAAPGTSESASADDPVFSCREVRLTPDFLSTRLNQLTIESMMALEPTCLIIRRAEDGRTNLAGVLESVGDLATNSYFALPTVELRGARVKVIDRGSDGDRVVEDLKMTVRARPSRRDSSIYDIVWQGGGSRVSRGYSQIDLRAGRIKNVHGGLPWMSVEAVMIAVNAQYDAAGTWSDLLGLDGIVRAQDYYLGGAADRKTPRSVTIELDNASLSIPIDERERPLSPDQRYLRFKQVYGKVVLKTDAIDAEFTGTFHGSKCDVSASITGGMDRLTTLDDVDFQVRLAVEKLELPQSHAAAPPQERRFIKRWRPIAKFFKNFDPHGYVDLEIEAGKRAGAEQPLVTRKVVLTALGGDASYHLFPYRAENVTGVVEFTPDGVFAKGVRGMHDGGVVTVDGWMTGPNRLAAAEFTVRGEDIPIDEALVDAVPAQYRRIRDLFRPEGSLDVAVTLARDAGTGDVPAPWRLGTTVSFDDLAASYMKFPYAMKHLSGTLTAERNRIEFTDVTGPVGDGRIRADGVVEFDGQRLNDVDVSLQGWDIALNEQLLSALPESMQRHAAAIRPGGQLNFETSLEQDAETGRLTHTTEVALRDAAIELEAFPIRIDDVEGRLVLTPTEFLLQEVTGRYHDGVISAQGKIDCRDPPRGTDLVIRCRDMVIDDALSAAAPTKLRAVLTTWRVDGPIAAEVSVRNDPADPSRAPVTSTVAWIDGVSVHHDRFPLPFEDVRAEISFDEGGARATGVQARYGSAIVSVDFNIRESEAGEEGTLRLTATSVVLDESLRNVVPEGIRNTWDRLGLSGRVNLHLDPLHYQRPDVGGTPIWSVSGRVDLDDVALEGVADIAGMTGTVAGRGLLVDRKGGTTLDGNVNLSAIEIFGRRVSAVTSPWVYAQVAAGRGRFALDSVEGAIYGGSLKGPVEINFDASGTSYRLGTVVHGMSIQPFLNAALASKGSDTERVNVQGLADVRMQLSGRAGDPSSRGGQGRVVITKGNMYRLPIMLAILHVINLSVPDQGVFDDAAADFYVVGNRVELHNLLLQGDILALEGYGSVSLPDRGLDLHLVNISPYQWARVPGLTDFVQGASREIVELHVTGPLWRPNVTPRPLPSISKEFKRLFQKKKPKKMEAVKP